MVDFLSEEEAVAEAAEARPEEEAVDAETSEEPPVPEWAEETMVIPSDLPPDTRESAIDKTAVTPPLGLSPLDFGQSTCPATAPAICRSRCAT